MKTLSISVPSKKRILIVNCFFDEMRFFVGRNTQVPQAMGPVYLAGAFAPETCEIRLFSEMWSGPLVDEKLLSWPDMLVLTGLNTAFDRMLHLTAYVRTKNPQVIVVAGGPAVRNLPNLSKKYFDYVCLGDVEELQLVAENVFGPAYVSPVMRPRHDLAYWMNHFGYVESSRYCNFKCAFCSLTGEGHRYRKYDLEFIRQQIVSLKGRKDPIIFIDNNFYGNDREFFKDRIELLKELKKTGYVKSWAALVTNDFFHREENLELAKRAGCMGLFSGLESFDADWLLSVNKGQNTRMSHVKIVRDCLINGIVFLYGSMLDVASRHLDDIRRELEFIFTNPEITLPSYLSIIVPILGTPLFYDCLDKGLLLPLTKLRDMESTTLCVKPLDPIEKVRQFVYDIQTLNGYKTRVAFHSYRFYRNYRRYLTPFQMAIALSNALKITFQNTFNLTAIPRSLRPRNPRRTHLTSTEPLDQVYTPAFPVHSRFADYFKPTLLTDDKGHITKDLEKDIFENKMQCLRAAV